jgi:hypothetical protein
MSKAARPIVVLLTLFLAAAMVAVVVLSGTGVLVGRLATPAPIATASAPTSPTPAGSPAPSLDQAQALAQIEAQVRDLRGLPAPDIGPPDVIDRDQLADEIDAMLDDSWTPEELRTANLSLRAMGLLTAEQDVRALTAQLLEGQVLGFYDPTQQRMVVVSDTGLTPAALATYAHEYTHALQDAAFSIGDTMNALHDDDSIMAMQALEEGDATVVMFQWAFAHLAPEELAQIGATPLPDTTGVPEWMLQQLEWPYLAGFSFVNTLTGGQEWAPVNDAFESPPASTEQVIHPEKYRNAELPVPVEAPQVAASMGAGWEDLEPNSLGEAMISIWLGEIGTAASRPPQTAAAGWGGDRMTVAAGPDGEWAMAWRIAWDSDAEAREFTDTYPGDQFTDRFHGEVLRTGATETMVLHASSAELLAQLDAAFGS